LSTLNRSRLKRYINSKVIAKQKSVNYIDENFDMIWANIGPIIEVTQASFEDEVATKLTEIVQEKEARNG